MRVIPGRGCVCGVAGTRRTGSTSAGAVVGVC